MTSSFPKKRIKEYAGNQLRTCMLFVPALTHVVTPLEKMNHVNFMKLSNCRNTKIPDICLTESLYHPLSLQSL